MIEGVGATFSCGGALGRQRRRCGINTEQEEASQRSRDEGQELIRRLIRCDEVRYGYLLHRDRRFWLSPTLLKSSCLFPPPLPLA